MADQSVLTGKGSSYYQMQQTLAIGRDSKLPIDIPNATYTFVPDKDGKYVQYDMTAAEQSEGVAHMKALVKDMRLGGGLAQGAIDYLENAMKIQLSYAEGWAKEQK